MPEILLKMLEYPEGMDLLDSNMDFIRKLIDNMNDNYLQIMQILNSL